MILNALHKEATISQSENAVLTRVINWAAWLDTNTISTSTWDGDGMTVSSESNTTTTATCNLTASPGKYRVINKITTSDGQTAERFLNITVLPNEYTTDYE